MPIVEESGADMARVRADFEGDAGRGGARLTGLTDLDLSRGHRGGGGRRE